MHGIRKIFLRSHILAFSMVFATQMDSLANIDYVSTKRTIEYQNLALYGKDPLDQYESHVLGLPPCDGNSLDH